MAGELNNPIVRHEITSALARAIDKALEPHMEDFPCWYSDLLTARMAEAAVATLYAIAEHESWMKAEGYTDGQ